MNARLRQVVIGGGGLLGLIILLEAVHGEARLARIDRAPLRPRPAAVGDVLPTESTEIPAQLSQWVATARARPLMTSARRPAAGAGDGGVTLNGGLPRLAGMIVTATGGIAIFAPESGGKPLVAGVGSMVGPYRVRKIAADGVTVDGPDGAQRLQPRFGPPHEGGFSNQFNPNPAMRFMPPGVPPPGMMPPPISPQNAANNDQ